MQTGLFIIIVLISYLLVFWVTKKVRIAQKDLFLGWTAKIVFSVLFVLVFSRYFGQGALTGDSYNFMHDSAVLNAYAHEDFPGYLSVLFGADPDESQLQTTILSNTHIWSYGDNGDFINDNRSLIRIHSVIHFFSLGNPYVHALIMALLSFGGILLLHQAFASFISNKRLFYWTLILFPSIGFWTSGISKEALLLFGLGLFFYGFYIILRKGFRLAPILSLLMGTLLILYNKPHVGLIVLSLSPFLLIGHISNWKPLFKWLFPGLVLVVGVLLVYAPPQINLLHKVSYKQKDLINIGKGGVFFVTDSSFCAFDYKYMDRFEHTLQNQVKVKESCPGTYKLFGHSEFYPFIIPAGEQYYDVYLIQPPSGSFIDTEPINYKPAVLLQSIPSALFNTLIRPLPTDPGSPLRFAAFFNNLLLIFFLIYAFFKRKSMRSVDQYLVIYSLMCALLILLLIGWTTPILGAIVRYKSAADIFLILAAFVTLRPIRKHLS